MSNEDEFNVINLYLTLEHYLTRSEKPAHEFPVYIHDGHEGTVKPIEEVYESDGAIHINVGLWRVK